ncbi:hypothetical protein [Kordiimonas gwangyangensis]|uniref:hypothetical protein n=1 Tax=Kordiimonas gwangyangensis TaxID=288022 RepID=UPI000372C339|nr:hypothetical protein [Kordiimonas gwangyangensis]
MSIRSALIALTLAASGALFGHLFIEKEGAPWFFWSMGGLLGVVATDAIAAIKGGQKKSN